MFVIENSQSRAIIGVPTIREYVQFKGDFENATHQDYPSMDKSV